MSDSTGDTHVRLAVQHGTCWGALPSELRQPAMFWLPEVSWFKKEREGQVLCCTSFSTLCSHGCFWSDLAIVPFQSQLGWLVQKCPCGVTHTPSDLVCSTLQLCLSMWAAGCLGSSEAQMPPTGDSHILARKGWDSWGVYRGMMECYGCFWAVRAQKAQACLVTLTSGVFLQEIFQLQQS